MWKRRTTLAAGLVTLASIAAGPVAAQGLPPLIPGCQLTLENDPERVLVETPLGTLTLQLFPSVAPVTVDNFLGYIDRGDYTDSIVHRVDPGFVIQAGGFAQIGINFGPIEAQDPIVNEPCISNVAGTIAMAKLGGDPDSATSQWFVNLADNSANLDTQNDGFTVFGRVLGGGLSIAADIANLEDQPPIAPLPPYLAEVEAASGGWEILLASPLLNPVVDAGVHGCFDVSQSGVLLSENPTNLGDLEPGTVQSLPFAITSTACLGDGTGGTPGFACNPPGRRTVRVDPDTFLFIPDGGAPFGVAEELLSCDDIAASEAGFTARLEDFGNQFDSALVKTTYTVPEPAAGLAAVVSLLALAGVARFERRRQR